MKRNHYRSGRDFPAGVAAIGIVAVVIGLIVLSPLALPALDAPGRDWERLSLIGESYGAISAVLAAVAVVAVTITLILQQRQIRDTRRLSVRQAHTDLLAMAMTDPELLKAWGPISRPPTMEPRLVLYTNLILNYLILLYELGAANEDEIRLNLKTMAAGDWSRSYWETTSEAWLTAYRGRQRAVVEMMAEELGATNGSRNTNEDA